MGLFRTCCNGGDYGDGAWHLSVMCVGWLGGFEPFACTYPSDYTDGNGATWSEDPINEPRYLVLTRVIDHDEVELDGGSNVIDWWNATWTRTDYVKAETGDLYKVTIERTGPTHVSGGHTARNGSAATGTIYSWERNDDGSETESDPHGLNAKATVPGYVTSIPYDFQNVPIVGTSNPNTVPLDYFTRAATSRQYYWDDATRYAVLGDVDYDGGSVFLDYDDTATLSSQRTFADAYADALEASIAADLTLPHSLSTPETYRIYDLSSTAADLPALVVDGYVDLIPYPCPYDDSANADDYWGGELPLTVNDGQICQCYTRGSGGIQLRMFDPGSIKGSLLLQYRPGLAGSARLTAWPSPGYNILMSTLADVHGFRGFSGVGIADLGSVTRCAVFLLKVKALVGWYDAAGSMPAAVWKYPVVDPRTADDNQFTGADPNPDTEPGATVAGHAQLGGAEAGNSFIPQGAYMHDGQTCIAPPATSASAFGDVYWNSSFYIIDQHNSYNTLGGTASPSGLLPAEDETAAGITVGPFVGVGFALWAP